MPLKMRRHLAPLAFLLALPFAAWGQAPVAAHAKRLAVTPLNQVAEVAPGVYLPLWRSPNGRVLALVAAGQTQPAPLQPAAPQIGSLLDYRLIGASSYLNSGLKLDVTPQTYVRGGVSQTTWSNAAAGCVPAQPGVDHSICLGSSGLSLFGTEVGAGYSGRTFGLDLSLGLSRAEGPRRDALPQIVPQLPTLIPGLPAGGLEGGSSLNARGQLLLGDDTHLDIGAGVGRIRVLPQLVAPGADSFDSKTLSLGLDRGPLSGNIVGRVLEPSAGTNFSIPGQRWTAIDLGVTLRLPWQGELSIGAQNLWSSGTPPLIAPGATSPEQTRVPYVQYHQDL